MNLSAHAKAAALLIKWIGHACFLLTTGAGAHIVLDPPAAQVGYKMPDHALPCDLLFISHNHFDHNNVHAVGDTPKVFRPLMKPGETTVKEKVNGETITAHRIFSYHDNDQGKERGVNTITVLDVDGIRIAHFGDLGQLSLTPEQLKQIGKVDAVMIPVGGFYTIDGTQAAAIIGQLHPRVIIPMHYKTPALNADLQTKLGDTSKLIDAMKGKAAVVRVTDRSLSLSKETLPREPTIYLLPYE